MRELSEVTAALWLRNQDSTLSIDRPLFGQHAASAYLDVTSTPPTPAEIDESFEVVLAIGTELGLGDFTGDRLARFGRRLAHQLMASLLPRIRRAGALWRDRRDEALPRRSVNWLGSARAEAPGTDLGRGITGCFGTGVVVGDVRRSLAGLWGGMAYQSRDQLLGVNSTVLSGLARAMFDAAVSDQTHLDELLAGADLLGATDPDERDAAVAALDAAVAYFGREEFEDLAVAVAPGAGSDTAFEPEILDRQLLPFSLAADDVVRLLVGLGADLRAFEVVQTRTDALASIVSDLMAVRGTSSTAIARGNVWTHDLLVVSAAFGLTLRRPTLPQARVLNEFLGGFATATRLRSGVAGLAEVLDAPVGTQLWQTGLARLQRLTLARKHLPRAWVQVPGLDVGPGATPAGGRCAAAIRLRGTAAVQDAGRAWLAQVTTSAVSRRDRARRQAGLRLLGGGRARWLRVEIPRGSSRLAVCIAVASPTPRPLDPTGRPIPLIVFGRRYSKYRGTSLLPLYPVGGKLCLSENGEYPFEGAAHDVLTAALARTCEGLFGAITHPTRQPRWTAGDDAWREGADTPDPRPVTLT